MRMTKRWGKLILCLIVLAGLFWVAYALTETQNGMRDSDFFSFWAAGKLLGEGGNPYDEVEWINIHEVEGTDWISDQTFLYPLPLALFFIPLGTLSLQHASILWLTLSQVMIMFSIYLCCRVMDWDRWKHYLVPLIIAALLFRGVLVTIRNGQLGAFLLFLISLGLYYWSQDKGFLSGLFFGFLFLKPSITGIFLVVVIVWFLSNRSWKALTGLGVTIGSLITITIIIQSGWILDWLMIGKGKALSTAGTTPTFWGLTAMVLPQLDVWLWVTLSLSFVLIAFGIFFLFKAKPEGELLYLTGVLLPLSLFITPYLWAYDHILLLVPIVLLVAKMDGLQMPFILNSSLFLFLDVVALILLFLASIIGSDRLSGILPLFIIGIMGFLYHFESRRKDKIKSGTESI